MFGADTSTVGGISFVIRCFEQSSIETQLSEQSSTETEFGYSTTSGPKSTHGGTDTIDRFGAQKSAKAELSEQTTSAANYSTRGASTAIACSEQISTKATLSQ